MANLLSNTTIGGYQSIHTGNIGSYALTSLPSHNHDDRYFTETESDGRFQPLENQRLSTGNSPTFADLYNNGWFRNYNNYGLYNQTHGNHFYATSNNQWTIAANGSTPQIVFRSGGYEGTIRGFVYADTSNQIGFLNNAGDWSLRTNSSKDTQIYGALTVGSGTSADIYMTDTDESTRRIHTNSGRIGFLSTGSIWGSYCTNDGSWHSDQSMRAPIFYDSADTGYYLDPNSTSRVLNIEAVGFVGYNSNQTRDKLRVWDSGTYTIGMKSGYDYGHLGTDEYAMSFQMNNNSGRGFWWGDEAHNDNQGAASLTTDGRMVIAKSLSIGEGEAVVSPSSVPLYVTGTTSGLDVLAVDGVNGRLFTVTDDLTDSLFSVNTIAGLPVIEAFADNTVKIGKYGSNSITISGSKIAINSDTVDANFPFYVGDRSVAGSRYSLTNKGMGFNLADNYAQLQLYGGNGSYIDFVTSTGQDSGGRIMWNGSNFVVDGAMYFNNASYTYTLYDRNDTNYYLDMNGTSRLGTLNINQLSVYGNTYLGDGNGDEVHINDILRVGATDSGDAHFYFGEGGSAGSDYGSHWYWDSAYTFNWYTRNAGTDTALFSYTTNDAYYVNWYRNFNMQNKHIHYINEAHFNGGTRFSTNDSHYLNFMTDATDYGAIRVISSTGALKGHLGHYDSNGFGLLNSSGNWGIRLNPGNAETLLFYAGDWRLQTRSGGTQINGNLYTNTDYGHGLVGLYSASRYQGVFAMSDDYKLSADGTSTGNLYGLAWSHPNAGGQTKAGLEHQLLVMNYGVTQTAIGVGIWTSGLITTTSYGTSANWIAAYNWGNHASAGYLTGITSGQVTGALGYTPYNSSNPNGYITGYTETNTFLGDGGAADTHPGTDRIIFTGQISTGAALLGMPATDNSNAILNINRHPGEYNSQLGFSSNGSMYYRSFSATAINNSQAWRQVWDSGNLTNLNQLSNGPGYVTSSALSSYVPLSGTTLTEGNYFYFRSNRGSYLGGLDSPSLQAYATGGNAAFMSFHRAGNYAVNFGLDSDNIMRIGGWSASADRWVLDMSGNNTVAGSFRAPIFYDSNDTNYYLDPNSNSNLTNLSIVGYQSIGGTTSNGQSNFQWDGATYQNPNQWTARLILRRDNASTGVNGSIPSLVIFNNNGGDQTTASMVFASNECVVGSNSVNLAGIVAKKESVGNCGGWSSGSLNFFVKNFATRIDSLALTPDGNATFSGLIYSTGYGNSSQWNTAFGWGNHASAGYLTSLPSHNHDDRYYTESESDGRYAYKAGAAGQDFSADKLNSYYLRNHYGVSTNHSYGMYFDNDLSSAYGIYRESGPWDHPYPDLRIAFHTGIKLGANSGYQGIKFYTDYDMVTQVMSVNNGSDPLGAGNVYVNNSLQAGSSLRAPIFYDSNDTGYYGDFASTSVMNAIRFGTSTNNGTLSGAGDWGMRLTTDSGNISFGPANSNHAHIYTDRPNFYFNKDLLVNNSIVITAATIGSQSVSYASTSGSLSSMNISQFTNNSGYITGISFANVSSKPTTISGYGITDAITTANIGSQSVSYATTAGSAPANGGNSSTVGGYSVSVGASANTIPTRNASGYFIPESWIQLNGIYGLYSPTNGAHLRPNDASYGSWQMTGSRNGWQGIEFNSGTNGNVTMMIATDSRVVGFHNNSYGWQIRWDNGTLYIGKGANGGTDATILDSSNYSSWAQPIASAINTGNIGSQSVSYATTAGTANAVAWTNVSSRPTALSQFSNDLGNYGGFLTSLPAHDHDRLFLTDSRGASRAPSYYDQRYAQWDFQNTSDTGAGGDGWHGLLTVAKWSSYDPSHRQEQLAFTGDELKRRTATSDSAWGSWKTIIDSGNIGSQSVSNAATVGGYTPSGSVGANTVVIRDANNYIYAHYINSNVSESENPTINSFYTSNGDGWLRKSSVAHVKSQLGLGSLAYLSSLNELDWYGYLTSENWNTYWTSNKLRVASVSGATGTGRPPTSVHNFGSLLSYGTSSGDAFQMYFPDNAGNSIANSRKLHYRTGQSVSAGPTGSGWCDWRTVVDMVGDTLTIVEGATPKIVVRGSTGYGNPSSGSIELVGDADGGNTQSYRWISTAPDWGGQEFRLERKVNNAFQLVGRVPKNTNNLEWQGTIVQGLSDSRVKTNVVSMTEGLDKIDRIRPVTFDWVPTENVSDREGADFGFIAQELEEVLPEVVHTRGDGYKTVMYEKVVPVLVQAMKEQQTMIEALRAEIELLKNK
jgi:hypothetical protein